MPEPRRVESSGQDLSSETGYDEQNWATHSIRVWIENDSSFNGIALELVRNDETGLELRDYLHRLLFARASLAYLERRDLTRADLGTLRLVAGETTPAHEVFDTINWKYVRASLLG